MTTHGIGMTRQCACDSSKLFSLGATLAVQGLEIPGLRSAVRQANSDTRFTMVTDDSLWHYIASVNSQPQSLSLAVACAALGVAAGSRYVVTEVSGARYGAR